VRFSSKSILILIGGHLATAPRAQKEAQALRAAGAEVAIAGTWWNDKLAAEDASLARDLGVEFKAVVDLRGGAKGRRRIRLLQRFARECFLRWRIVMPRVFGTGAPELLREATKRNADLTIVHSEAGLWVAQQLIRRGRRVGVDFEDWFSRDLMEADRRTRPVNALEALERELLRNASVCTTTTSAMAHALAEDAGTKRVPTVVMNCFSADDRRTAAAGPRDAHDDEAVSFHWFSQTIGPGRGLESLARALPLLRGRWIVTLRGALRSHSEWFERTFAPWVGSRVFVLEPVDNRELLARTMSHDVGLALEEPYCESRDLTATNKLFEYFRAGLAVIATRTRGQAEVMMQAPEAGRLVTPADHGELASAMQTVIDDRNLLHAQRKLSACAGQTTFAWESHVENLVGAVAAGLNAPVTAA